jgi:ABC-type xylose transport system permease subunit
MTGSDHSYETSGDRSSLAREAGVGKLSFISVLAGVLVAYGGTVASGVQSNRRPPPESLNAIGDAKIGCFEHFWQSSGREAAPLCYPPTAPSGQMQQCLGRSSPSTQTIIRLVRVVCDETASHEDGP